MDRTDNDTIAWYKQPLVWMLIGIPGMAVVMGIVIISLAISSNDGLVTDDYYKKGLEINRVLERDHEAATHQLTAEVDTNKQSGELLISLTANPDFVFPTQILVDFSHSTRSGFDTSMIIDQDAASAGHYSTVLPDLVNGRWNVQISAAGWRLMESVTFKSKQQENL